MIRSKILSVSAINGKNSPRASDKNNIPLIKTCALNKKICARHHDFSTKSALSTMRQPVQIPLLSNSLRQN